MRQAVCAGLTMLPCEGSVWHSAVPGVLSQNAASSGFLSSYSTSGQMEAVPYEKNFGPTAVLSLLRAHLICIIPLSKSSQPIKKSKEWRAAASGRSVCREEVHVFKSKTKCLWDSYIAQLKLLFLKTVEVKTFVWLPPSALAQLHQCSHSGRGLDTTSILELYQQLPELPEMAIWFTAFILPWPHGTGLQVSLFLVCLALSAGEEEPNCSAVIICCYSVSLFWVAIEKQVALWSVPPRNWLYLSRNCLWSLKYITRILVMTYCLLLTFSINI